MREGKNNYANLEEVTESQVSMRSKQKGKFYSMLKRVEKIFFGKERREEGPKRSIKLKSGAINVYKVYLIRYLGLT